MCDRHPNHIAFTGTRQGMTPIQRAVLRGMLRVVESTTFGHGCAVGADAEAHAIAKEEHYDIYGLPSNIEHQRAALTGFIFLAKQAPPLKRNRALVDWCDYLYACPATMQEIKRSGTWATIRYARQEGKEIVIVYPDGSLS